MPASSQTRVRRLTFIVVAVALSLALGFSIWSAASIAVGRGYVERDVGYLVALQRFSDGSARPEDSARVARELTQHPDADVAAAAARLSAALERGDAGAEVAGTIAALRRVNARQSERLGAFIDRLYFTVAFLVVLAAATLALLWRLQSNAEERERLAERRLETARFEHEQQLQMVNALAAVIAHEVNNPLSSVMLGLEHVGRQVEKSLPALSDDVAACADGAQRIRDIVTDLRRLATPGKSDGGVELGRVIKSTVKLLAHRIDPRVRLELELEEQGGVTADYVGLGQVLSNLLINAVEAFGDRPFEQNALSLRTRVVEDEWAEVLIEDNGPGFDPRVFAKLATPFVTTKPHGSGLGLFVCRRIVEGFGGTLTLSPRNPGAAVRVLLKRRIAKG